MADADAIDAEILRLKSQRQRQLDVLLDAAGEIEDLQAEFRAKRDKITAEITTLTAKAGASRSENTAPSIPTMEWFNGLTTMWSGADTGMVNEALRSVIKRIYVQRADVLRDDLVGRLHVIGLWANNPYQPDLSPLRLLTGGPVDRRPQGLSIDRGRLTSRARPTG